MLHHVYGTKGNNPAKPCVVYGVGGFGREVAWLLHESSSAGSPYVPVCFVDDDPQLHGGSVVGLPIMDLATARHLYPDAGLVVAIGNPQRRCAVVQRTAAQGWAFPSVAHPTSRRSDYVAIGEGTLLCANAVLTTQIVVGEHVHLNLGCTVGHDVTIGSFCTFSPGVHVSGWVQLGQRVFVGSGAVIVNGTEKQPLIVGDDAVIGASACVTHPVPAGQTVVGVPAKPIVRAR